MKLNIQKCFRVIAPLFLAVFIVFFSASSAFAVSMSVPAGIYTFAEQIDMPDQAFLANISFVCNDIAYKGIIYKPPDLEATFRYGAIYYIRADNGVEERVCYWISDETYWIGYFYRVIAVQFTYMVENSNFYAWFVVNSSKAEHGGTSGKFPDYSESQDIQDALDRLEGIDDEYNKLPEPEFWDDWYGAAIFQTDAYESYLTVLDVLYADSLITNIITVACPLILVSFLIFAGKA